MDSTIVRLYKPPKPTLADPHAQIKWIFFQLEAEHGEPRAASFRNAKNKYLQFVTETKAYYTELHDNPRFYLDRYWEVDALIRFNKWLHTQGVASKTRYSIYKSVRQVMDMAYALRVIDTIVYHAPMFEGVSETNERTAYPKREQEIINAGVAKWISLAESVIRGYSLTGEGVPYRRKNLLESVAINGRFYKTAEAAIVFGVKHSVITTRIKEGWTPRQAVGLDRSPNQRGFQPGFLGTKITVEGVEYESISAAARAYGLNNGMVAQRLRKGYTPEQAVLVAPIHVLRGDDRALLWMFENQYGCDAYKMIEDLYKRRQELGYVCSEKQLLKLFSKWGVWPYVDDRLIMPLVVEMAMLTGLNVEALKELEIDSYQTEHQLTGQPVIIYRKRRSGSSTRSEDRELHLPTLELEELYLDDSVTSRVNRLITLILTLTSKIRDLAPVEISRRLFIFEDVERSRKERGRIIVSLDPRRKAGHWYRRFCNDEGLYRIFGPRFNFNVSRCRPTLATNMVLAGADLFQVQVALGHESIQTTATYLDEKRLRPAFNKTISEALENISHRSLDLQHGVRKEEATYEECKERDKSGFHDTLSGCGCIDPYRPSESVKKATNFQEGSVCKYWNMCLLCDRSVITEHSLPKLILYRSRVASALELDSPSIKARKELFKDVLKLIDGILKPDVIFPADVIDNANCISATMDDLLVDQLIYQGI